VLEVTHPIAASFPVFFLVSDDDPHFIFNVSNHFSVVMISLSLSAETRLFHSEKIVRSEHGHLSAKNSHSMSETIPTTVFSLKTRQPVEQTIDPETLLTEEDLQTKKPASDCSAKPRACKNCTCGRAEKEAAGQATVVLPSDASGVDASSVPKSSCGNCSRGDAFRCAGCPYRGLPPFQPGERVALVL